MQRPTDTPEGDAGSRDLVDWARNSRIAAIAVGLLVSGVFVALTDEQYVALGIALGALLLGGLAAEKEAPSWASRGIMIVGCVGMLGLLGTHYLTPTTETVMVTDQPMHLGNVEMSSYQPSEPGGAADSVFVELTDAQYDRMQNPMLLVRVKGVDPTTEQGPLVALVNGMPLKPALNELEPYASMNSDREHRAGPKQVELTVPMGALRPGRNKITFFSVPVAEEADGRIVKDIDDVNILRVDLRYEH